MARSSYSSLASGKVSRARVCVRAMAALLAAALAFVTAPASADIGPDGEQLFRQDDDGGRGPRQSVFRRIATFPVFLNTDVRLQTVAEIVAASEDGKLLVYTDAATGNVGFVDIEDPANPLPAGVVDVDGQPTSVAVAGGHALVAVNTSPDFLNPSGNLKIIDLNSRQILRTIDLGGQPDSVAVSPDKRYAAIA